MKRKFTIFALAVGIAMCLLAFTGCSGECKVHEFTSAECIWNDDGTALVVATCGVCGGQITEQAAVSETVTKQPTCTQSGTLKRTATVSIGGNTFNTFESPEQQIKPVGHDYGATKYTWREQGGVQYCKASKSCAHCNDKIEEEVASRKVTTAPTCYREGENEYTATFTKGFKTAQKTESIAKTAHNYGNNITYTWKNHKCTATESCLVCGEKRTVSAASVVYEEVRAATCTEDGVGRNVATFTDSKFATQTETVTIPKHHDYGEPECRWDAGHTECTAKSVCVRCGDEVYKTANASDIKIAITKAATCTEDGERVYSATFEFDGKRYTSNDREVIPSKGGHDYGEIVYLWSADYRTCTAKKVCKECGDKISEVQSATSTVTKNPTCTEDGNMKYTVSFVNEEFVGQTKEVIIPRKGHSQGKVDYLWNDNHTSCTVKIYCSACDEVYYEETTENITNTVIKEPTCSEKGERRYVAVFSRSDLRDVEYVEETATHKYDEPTYRYFWEDGVLKCEASKTCVFGETVSEIATGKFVSDNGKVKFVVEFEDEDFETQTYEITISE